MDTDTSFWGLIYLFYRDAPTTAWLALAAPFVALLAAWVMELWYDRDMHLYTYALLPTEPAPLFTLLRLRGKVVGFELRAGKRRVFGAARRVPHSVCGCRGRAKSGEGV